MRSLSLLFVVAGLSCASQPSTTPQPPTAETAAPFATEPKAASGPETKVETKVDPPATDETTSAPKPADDDSAPEDELIVAQGQNRYLVKRQVLDDSLANPASIGNVRTVPVEEDGKPTRLRLTRIEEGSILDRIGLRNDDEIETINGYDLSAPDEALKAYAALRKTNELTVALVRNGKNLTLVYELH